MSTTQDGRFLQIDTPLGKDVLLISGFRVRESISQPFVIHVDAVAELTKADQVTGEALIGKKALITVALKEGERYFHGMINRLVEGSQGPKERFVHFQLEILPKLSFLANRTDLRIFQAQSVPDILKEMLKDLDVDFQLKKPYLPRDYCVQYRETDLNFVSRLMEDEGIFYFFKHEKGVHTMVVADEPESNKPCPVQSLVNYIDEGYADREDTVLEWTVSEELRPGLMTLRDHHFQLPDKNLEVGAPTKIQRENSKLEIYDYPGDYAKLSKNPDTLDQVEKEGPKITHRRMAREETAYEEANGSSNVRTFSSGFRFTLKHRAKKDWNMDWLLTSVQHSAFQSPGYTSIDAAADANAYSNRFTCIPYKIPFLPERVTPKPVVRGPQTAVVVGSPGEEIWPDKFGRVKVQFFWDRLGKKDDKSSCWIRVAQPWAGKNWGFVAIPRVGHEVVVDFLEGDPDQPIIVGSVYNADNMPPYALPGHKTQTGIKTRSADNGGPANFNEIRFEDLKGKEDLYVHAERTFTGEVEADETRTVGGSRTTKIYKDETETVETGDHNLTVSKGNRVATIAEGSDTLFVMKGSVLHSVNSVYMVTADTIQIAAKSTIQLICGGSSIIMTPEVIVIQGGLVKIN